MSRYISRDVPGLTFHGVPLSTIEDVVFEDDARDDMSRYITSDMFAPPYTPDVTQWLNGRRYAYVGAGVNVYEPVVILKPERIHLDDHVRLDALTKLEGGQGVRIGKHVHIASFSHINVGGGQVTIMDYAGLSSGVKILGGTNKMEGRYMSASAPADEIIVERLHTVLGPNSFYGAGCIILPGVTVGEGAVIGAGAVVTKDVEDWAVMVGVPGRKIGERPRPTSAHEVGQMYGIEV